MAAILKILESFLGGERTQDRAKLQADQHEREHVQDEHDQVPHGIRREAVACRDQARCVARHRYSVDDDRHDRGQVQMLGENPHAEGARKLQHDRARHIGNAQRRAACTSARADIRRTRCRRWPATTSARPCRNPARRIQPRARRCDRSSARLHRSAGSRLGVLRAGGAAAAVVSRWRWLPRRPAARRLRRVQWQLPTACSAPAHAPSMRLRPS